MCNPPFRKLFECLIPGVAATLAMLPGAVAVAAEPARPDFCFLQISDIHISPHPRGVGPTEGLRGKETLAWLCAEAGRPQAQTPYNVTAPPPAFIVATGDITEYGVIGTTWRDVERVFEPLPESCPLHVLPGNHDNTWTSMNHILRQRHQGDSYSFDRFGCHFVCLNSTSPQEPVPCLDRRTLNWLRVDLANVGREVPVFLFMHHPLSTDEFASPYEQLRLLDVIEGHRVVLILDGHGHNPKPGVWQGIDRVMGGSTYGDNAGYNIISVLDGVLRVTYRLHSGKPMLASLEKPLFDRRPQCEIGIQSPSTDKPVPGDGGIAIQATVRSRRASARTMTFDIDGNEKAGGPLEASDGTYRARFDASVLTPGWHFVRVTAANDGKRTWQRATMFEVSPRASGAAALTARRHQHDAGIKAAPLLHGELVVVVDTAGAVTAFERELRRRWRFKTGGEVLATPAVAGEALLFTSGDGRLYALDAASGRTLWQYDIGGPAFGRPVVVDGIAYFGDLEGAVHAVHMEDGRKLWARRHTTFSIEASGALCGDAVVFGAWDGWIYAVSRADGSLKWKQRCPTGQGGQTSRYFAAADCPPAVAEGRLFIADRGYNLGLYEPDGRYARPLQKNCSAVGSSEDGRFVYARSLGDGLTKYDGEGNVVWKQAVPLGRFPIPPTERAGRVYVCSNRGLLTVMNAADGRKLWEYQVSPQLHVMAGVAADADGTAYAADMDGGLVRVGQ